MTEEQEPKGFLNTLWSKTPWPVLRYNILALNRFSISHILVLGFILRMDDLSKENAVILSGFVGGVITYLFMAKDKEQ